MYTKLKDLPLNEATATVVLLVGIEEKETNGGKPYCRFTLSDGTNQIEANIWNKSKADIKVPEKSLVTVKIATKMYHDAVSYEVREYGPAPDDCKIEDYILKAPYDPQQMYTDILTCLRKEVPKTDPTATDLVDLVISIYEAQKEKLLYWSAAKSVHHNFYGGLLYHVFRMVRTGIVLSRVYQVDKEVLLAGLALHDIGKLMELETDNLGIADYSVDGTLFGHALLGIELINEEVQRKSFAHHTNSAVQPYNTEKVRLLKHAICAHHGNLDWGAITIAATPEAMLLHHIDMIDSRMYQFEHTLEDMEPGTKSDKVFGLGGQVYKPNFNKEDNHE